MPTPPYRWIAKYLPWKPRNCQDNLELAIPKPGMRLRSPKIYRASGKDFCELCGYHPLRPGQIMRHHIRSRGAGGADSQDNLISLCARCNGDVHDGRVCRGVLERIVAHRLAKQLREDRRLREESALKRR